MTHAQAVVIDVFGSLRSGWTSGSTSPVATADGGTVSVKFTDDAINNAAVFTSMGAVDIDPPNGVRGYTWSGAASGWAQNVGFNIDNSTINAYPEASHTGTYAAATVRDNAPAYPAGTKLAWIYTAGVAGSAVFDMTATGSGFWGGDPAENFFGIWSVADNALLTSSTTEAQLQITDATVSLGDQYWFVYSGQATGNTGMRAMGARIDITPVPEPSTYAL